MLPVESEAFKAWLLQAVIDTGTDSEVDTLLQYVLALLSTENTDDEIKASCKEELEVFLGDDTAVFVDKIFEHVHNTDYDVSAADLNGDQNGEEDLDYGEIYDDDDDTNPAQPIASVVSQPVKRRRSSERYEGESKRVRQASPEMTFVVASNDAESSSDEDRRKTSITIRDDPDDSSHRDGSRPRESRGGGGGDNDLRNLLRNRGATRDRDYEDSRDDRNARDPRDDRYARDSRDEWGDRHERNARDSREGLNARDGYDGPGADQAYNPEFAAVQTRRLSGGLERRQNGPSFGRREDREFDRGQGRDGQQWHSNGGDFGPSDFGGRGRRPNMPPGGPQHPVFRPPGNNMMDMNARGGGRGGRDSRAPRPQWNGPRGQFNGQPQQFPNRNDDRPFDLRYLANTLLEVKDIPAELNTTDKLSSWFEKFGSVVKIEPCYQGNEGVAIVEYKLNTEAKAAFQSEHSVLGNQFIKVNFVPCNLQEKTQQQLVAQIGGPAAYEEAKHKYVERYRLTHDGRDPPPHFLNGSTPNRSNQNAGGWRGNHGNHTEWVEPEYTQEEIDAWEAQQKKAQEDFAAQKIAEFKALKAAKATAAATTQHRLNELTKDRIANLLSQQKTLMAEIATMDKTAKKEAMKKLMGFVDEMKKLRQQMEIRKSAAIAQKPTPAPLPPVASAYAALNQPLPGSRKQSTYRSAAVLASDELKRLQLDNELNAIAQGNSETPTDTPHAAPVDPPAQPPRTYTPTNTPQTAQQTPMQAAAQAHVKPMARTVSANPLVTSNSIYISGVSSAEDIEQLRQMLLKFGPLAQESAMTVRGKGIVASYAMKESCAKVLAAGIVLNGKKLPMVLWVTPTANPTPAPAASVSAIENDDQIV